LPAALFVLAQLLFALPSASQQCSAFDTRYELICVQGCPDVEAQVLLRRPLNQIYRLYRTASTICGSSTNPDSCRLYGFDPSGGYFEYSAFDPTTGSVEYYINGWVDVHLIDPTILAPAGTRVYLKLRRDEGCIPQVYTCPGQGPSDPTSCLNTPWLFHDQHRTPHPMYIFELTGRGTDPSGCSEDHRISGCYLTANVNANLLCPGELVDVEVTLCNMSSVLYGGCTSTYTWSARSSNRSVVQIEGPYNGIIDGLEAEQADGSSVGACKSFTIPVRVQSGAAPGSTAEIVLEVKQHGSEPTTISCGASVFLRLAPSGSDVCRRIDVVFVPANYPMNALGDFENVDVPAVINEFKTTEPFATYFDLFSFHTVVPPDPSTVPNPYDAPDVDEIIYLWNGLFSSGETVYASECHPGPAFCPPAPGNGISTILSSSWPGRVMFGVGQSFMPQLGIESPGTLTWPFGENFIADTPNLTSIDRADSMKWAEWIDPPPVQQGFVDCNNLPVNETPIPTPDCWIPPPGSNGIGAWEGGFDYGRDIFRPAFQCLMNDRTGYFEFCVVCRQALVSSFYAYESIPLFQVVAPQGTVITASGNSTVFLIDPIVDTLAIEWSLDGMPIGETTKELVLDNCSLAPGLHTVEVTVRDATPWVRRDLFGAMRPQTWSWTLEVGGGVAGTILVPSQMSLEEALGNAADGSVIRIAAGTFTAVDLAVPCGRSLVIEGDGMERTLLTADANGDGQGDGRLFSLEETGAVEFRDLTLAFGAVGGFGAAIEAVDAQSLDLVRCRFLENQAARGAAVFARNLVYLNVENCIFAGNASAQPKGALVLDQGTLRLRNSTFHGNSGGAVDLTGGVASLIQNCIFSSNGLFGVRSESLSFIEWSAVYDHAESFSGFARPRNGVLQTDPLLVDVSGVDPLAWDLHLSPMSPCIDAGNPSDPFPDEPFPAGCAINIGAYGGTIEARTSSPCP